MTLELLAANAGISVREVARYWPHYRPRLSEKQLRNRISRIRHVIAHGRIGDVAAEKLATLLDCDPALFIYGQGFWSKSSTEGLPGKARRGGGY